MSGTNQGGRAIAAKSILASVAAGGLDRAQQILGVQDADDVLRLALPQRNACDLRFQHLLHHLLGRIVGADRDHLGAMDHDVGDGEIAQVEKTAEHVAILLLHAAFMVQQVHGSAQFLMAQSRNAWSAPTRYPNKRKIQRTSASMPTSMGPNRRTIHEIGRTTNSATRSGALIATVLGSTSVNTTTATVMIIVA